MLYRIYLTPLCSTIRITLIQGRGQSCRECTSEKSLPFLKSNHNKASVYPLVGPSTFLVAQYTEKDLQKILRTILKASASLFDGPREKSLKTRSPDVYCGKSHIEYYNFCQQYKDHFATARAKGPNHIPFATSLLFDRINFCWQQYKQKHEVKNTVPITWEEFKTFLCQSLRDSRAFINSYWAKIKRDSQY